LARQGRRAGDRGVAVRAVARLARLSFSPPGFRVGGSGRRRDRRRQDGGDDRGGGE
jgi:hypothetical protein